MLVYFYCIKEHRITSQLHLLLGIYLLSGIFSPLDTSHNCAAIVNVDLPWTNVAMKETLIEHR